MLKTRLFVVLILTLAISSCTQKKDESEAKGTKAALRGCVDAPVIYRIHGSNTIGAKLMPDIVIGFLENRGAEAIKLIRGETIEEKIIRARFDGRCTDIEIHGYGSSTGFNDLAWGKCEMAMSSKPINEESISRLQSLGDMKSSNCEHVLALDGIAVLVNRKNPLSSVSIPVLRKIFAGAITDWTSVIPGYEGKINLYRRDDNSGTHEVFKTLVMGKSALTGAVVCLDNRDISEKVTSDPYAIGYTSITFVGDNKALNVSAGSGEKISPDHFNVQTEDYPLSRRLLLYTPEKKSPLVTELLEYALSNSGQKVVEKNGFVAQTLRLVKPDPPQNASEDYLYMTRNALRLSVNFRFNSGAVLLDNRALADVRRLEDFFKGEQLDHCNLMLFGFSDNYGKPASNWSISRIRARVAAKTIHDLTGIKAKVVKGFGPLMPVASNSHSQGRMKNRRVELWISCLPQKR